MCVSNSGRYRTSASTKQYAAYAEDEIAFGDKITVTPGVRVDYYQLEPEPDDIYIADNPGASFASITETSVSPKLGALWQMSERYSLYVNYAHGFRAPPYNDVNIGFTSNESLYLTGH